MATDIFSMEYSALTDLAIKISDMDQDFQNMLSDLDNLVDSLDGQWQGKAQVEFATAYNELRPKLSKIGEVLGNYAKEINNATCSEQNLESSNKSIFDHVNIPPL